MHSLRTACQGFFVEYFRIDWISLASCTDFERSRRLFRPDIWPFRQPAESEKKPCRGCFFDAVEYDRLSKIVCCEYDSRLISRIGEINVCDRFNLSPNCSTVKKLATIFISCLFAGFAAFGQDQNAYKTLSAGFKTPPSHAMPAVYHWWLGGNVDTVRLKQELIAFKEAGISGFTMFEIGSRDTVHVKSGPPYLEDESLAVIKFAVEQAGKLGLEAGLNTASSWNAGGNWVTPEYAAKSIYVSKVSVNDRSRQKIKIPFPEIPEKDPRGRTRLIQYGKDNKPVYYREIAVLAVPVRPAGSLDTASIVNVTRYYDSKNETLTWKVPAGEWEIQRYVSSNSGENLILPSKHSAGPIMDHYDAASTEFHFMYIINKLESVLGDLRKTALKSLYMASYEMKGFTWTPTLPQEFKKINGYDITKMLPGLFNEKAFSPEVQANLRVHFQQTLSELMINNFYKKSKEICNRHGLKNNSEAGGPGMPIHMVPVEPLKALGSLDIPRGEYWINHPVFDENGIDVLRVVKEVSAASHIYNRGIVEMEAFTSFQHWREGPFEMKPTGDRAFAEGMNKVVVHGSTHNPAGTGFPGIVYHAGTHYNDKRVWWPKIKPFNEYLGRISYILQEADFVADVLYYYGDTIPNLGGHKNSRFMVGPGYDYEIVNTEILKEATVKNGRIVLPRNNASFAMLALTDEQKMNPDILVKLDQLASQGAIIVGKKPKGVTGVQPKVDALRDKLWVDLNNKPFPKKGGKVYDNIAAATVLESMGIGPDFSYPGKEFNTLDYIHYAKGGVDFYFIRNTTADWVSRNTKFRQSNRIPELWNPVNGEIVSVPVYNHTPGGIDVPLTLPPYGSLFVVFRNGQAAPRYVGLGDGAIPPLVEYAKDGIYVWSEGDIVLKGKEQQTKFSNFVDVQMVDGSWEVFFPKGWDAPEKVFFHELTSWTEHSNEGVKYFSGTATYKKTFQYDLNAVATDKKKIYLDLGDLAYVGEVWLNDRSLGITWAKPYRFDVTDILKPGNNSLVVEIANTWNNRLVGDAITGKKFTSTNINDTNVYGLNNMRLPWKDVPLLKSGLFGPVRIYTLKPLD